MNTACHCIVYVNTNPVLPYIPQTQRLRPLSYSKSHIILIAFSLDTPDSLDNVLSKWIEEVRSICGPDIPVMLVGCKRDLRDAATEALNEGSAPLDENKFVTFEKGQKTAREIGARLYKECSALKNDGVDDIFEAATRQAMLVKAFATSSTNAPGASGTIGARNGSNGLGGLNGEGRAERRKSSGNMLNYNNNEKTNGSYGAGAGSHGDSASKGCCIVV
jgi:Rho family protein